MRLGSLAHRLVRLDDEQDVRRREVEGVSRYVDRSLARRCPLAVAALAVPHLR